MNIFQSNIINIYGEKGSCNKKRNQYYLRVRKGNQYALHTAISSFNISYATCP